MEFIFYLFLQLKQKYWGVKYTIVNRNSYSIESKQCCEKFFFHKMISIQEIENKDFPFCHLESESQIEHRQKQNMKKDAKLNVATTMVNQVVSFAESLSEKETDQNTEELQLESKMSKQQPIHEDVKINISYNPREITEVRQYEKMFVKCSTNNSKGNQEEMKPYIIGYQSNKNEGALKSDDKQKGGKLLLQPELTLSNLSSAVANGSELHFTATESMVFISQDQSQNNFNAEKKQEGPKKRKTKLKKQTVNEEIPRCHTGPQFMQVRRKSLKKVTFIGDSDVPDEEENQPQTKKKPTINSEKEQSSMTSILGYKERKNKQKNMQGSRKIISQDQNHSLYRLIGYKKSEQMLMCRSVEIKEDLTQQRQLKMYLQCRQNEHQNIVKMHSFEKSIRQNNRYHIEIKMDFYPKNLEEYLLQTKKSQSTLQIERKLILFQILKALNYIHSRDICHRDLNPHNIMLGDELETAITNFAYVKNTSKEYSQDNFYECNCYIRPPEVILQPLRYFQKGGDIWSFGCLVVYMLKGQLPFLKSSDADIVLEMIKIMGVPSKEYLDGINFKDWRKFIFPKMYKKSMRQTFKCYEMELLEMLKKIFIYDPSKRATASVLLCSRYFDEIRQQTAYKRLANIYNINNLFTFGPNELTKEEREIVVPEWY